MPLTDAERKARRNARVRAHRTRNRDRVRAIERKSRERLRADCPDTYTARQRADYEKRRAAHMAYLTTWRRDNQDKVRAYRKIGRERRKERARRAATVEATIRAFIPNGLPADLSTELYQELAIVYLMNGTVTADDARAALKDLRRKYPVISGRELSLNVPAYRDGSREEWIDRLEAR